MLSVSSTARAPSTLSASTTRYPSSSRLTRQRSLSEGSSSTTSTVAGSPPIAFECIDGALPYLFPRVDRYPFEVGNQTRSDQPLAGERVWRELPRPTESFRRRSWLEFQRALDPLAPPKPLRRGLPRDA